LSVTTTVIWSSFFLCATFILSSVSNAIRSLRLRHSKSKIKTIGKTFFFSKILNIFFKEKNLETLIFSTACAKTSFSFFFVTAYTTFLFTFPTLLNNSFLLLLAILMGGFLLVFFGEFLPRLIANRHPLGTIKIFSLLSSILLTITFPFLFPLIWLSPTLFRKKLRKTAPNSLDQIKEKIIDILQEENLQDNIDPNEQKLIESIISFKDRIVREIMVPRVEVFSLKSTTSIREAALRFKEKGFSRIPVFEDTVDQIIGVLMYKEILALYSQCESKQDFSSLDACVSTIIKPVFYTPETKKISMLLQEFRKKQLHIAIVVDEYGGTEGIITIEDILEEIVGEIVDEYDQEKELFSSAPEGGWIVDARMSILDIEEKLGLKIPQDGDFDTVGGYVFHKAGEIPHQGLVIHHDTFELEILSSNERCVEKIHIHPITSTKEASNDN
jgi:putative hemolysin